MGVDPGLTRCGLSVIETGKGRTVTALDVDVVRTPSDVVYGHHQTTYSRPLPLGTPASVMRR